MERAEERKLVLAMMFAHNMVHIIELSFPSVALLVGEEFFGNKQAYEEIGFAYFILSLCYGFSSLPAGRLIDRLGAKKALFIYFIGAGIGMSLCAIASKFFQLVLSLALVGISIGLYHPAGLTLISLGTKRYSRGMGWHGVGGNMGLAISPFLVASLSSFLGFRITFLILGIFMLILALVFLKAKFLELNLRVENSLDSQGLKKGIWVEALFILFVLTLFNGMVYRGLMTFLPSYFSLHIKPDVLPWFSEVMRGGFFTTLSLVLGMLGQWVGGELGERYNREKLYAGAFLAGSFLVFFISYLYGISLVLFTMVFSFIYFSSQPVGNALLPRYSGESVRGRFYGIYFFINFGAGSFMSWIAGMVGESYQIEDAFRVLALTLFLAGLFGLLLIKITVSNNYLGMKR